MPAAKHFAFIWSFPNAKREHGQNATQRRQYMHKTHHTKRMFVLNLRNSSSKRSAEFFSKNKTAKRNANKGFAQINERNRLSARVGYGQSRRISEPKAASWTTVSKRNESQNATPIEYCAVAARLDRWLGQIKTQEKTMLQKGKCCV